MRLKFEINKSYDVSLIEDKKMLSQIDDIYLKTNKYLKLAVNDYQESWDMIGKKFSDYIQKETSYDWFYETYRCVISPIHQGISNWGCEGVIVRWWRENAYSMRRITAHELILSHYFEIYKRHYSQENLTDEQVWALAEIAAFALTSLTGEVKSFWPWDYSGYYTNHNYPEIVKLQKKLKNPFLRRKNFDEYMKIGFRNIKAL